MTEAFIRAVHTAIGRFGGALVQARPDGGMSGATPNLRSNAKVAGR